MYFLLTYREIWLRVGDVSSELLTSRRHVDLRRQASALCAMR
ncbi:putative leader peptide [Planobispora takensis]